MPPRQSNPFTTIRTEGGLLPANFLQRVTEGDRGLEGIQGADYHLLPEERFNEVITRSWTRLLTAWETFSKAMGKLPESDLGTTITRERWLLPLFQELGYGRLQTSKSFEIEGKSYPISHMWENCPIHIVSFRLDIDKRTAGTAGAARTAPHGLLQEFLNRSDDHLWGFVSNGLTLRILRDNVSFTRQSYVEFDLEAMMDGEVYADFVLLWLLCHESRVEAERSEECWLERWCKEAQERGTRALDTLRVGVEKAISSLGSGFLSANRDLRDKLFSGKLDKYDYYRQLLRLVYRLLFLFVAEDRDLLLAPDADPKSKERYLKYYSLSRIRTLALKQRGGKHGDLWHMLSLVFSALGSEHSFPALGLSPLGSFLWSSNAIPDLTGCNLSNRNLLESVRHLAFTVEGRIQRPVDYRNLGSEELGSIYESLLELHPDLNTDAQIFELKTAAGNERKTTGSYYTPTSLITCLLDSALNPVLEETVKKSNPEQEILGLKICDPACGSGHFLVAASHRVAKRLAAIRTGDAEPSPGAHRDALREVIARCIYGVDLNPMSVELCKVSLWMESMEPGKPLAFLDHHILCGNSLLGTTPALLIGGIPDEAFKPIKGDDTDYCKKYKAINKQERKTKQMTLFAHDFEKWEHLNDLARDLGKLNGIDDGSIEGIKEKQRRYEEIIGSYEYEQNRFLYDAWCSAFVWKKEGCEDVPYPITEEVFRTIESNPKSAPSWLTREVQRLASQYRFFHWHLAFPDVFRIPDHSKIKPDNEQTGWSGGFDVVLGNPPWEKIKLQEKEWFASSHPDIANAPTAAIRGRLIKGLEKLDPSAYSAFGEALRQAEGESAYIRNSKTYLYGNSGDTNTYPLFIEQAINLLEGKGRVGLIVKTGILADFSLKEFFSYLVKAGRLISAHDFSNRNLIFPAVVANERFTLLTLGGVSERADLIQISILNEDVADLGKDNKVWELSLNEVALINPNTLTCPLFQTSQDVAIVSKIYRNIPVLIEENNPHGNKWGVSYFSMFHMTNDSGLFKDVETLQQESEDTPSLEWNSGGEAYSALLEGKLYDIFEHRHGTFVGIPREKRFGTKAEPNHPTLEQYQDPVYQCLPRYWVPKTEVQIKYNQRIGFIPSGVLTFRDVCRTHTDLRTVRACVCPPLGAGNKAPLLVFPSTDQKEHTRKSLLLCGNMNTIVFDYIARQKFSGGSLNKFILIQLPVVPPSVFDETCSWSGDKQSYLNWFLPRILELSYTSWDLEPISRDCGYNIPPFRWDENRRFFLRCEIDAAFFHLYLEPNPDGQWSPARIDQGAVRDETSDEFTQLKGKFPSPRDAVTYIMDTFPILRRREEEKYGEYRTKRYIQEIFNEMTEAVRTGQAYQSILDPLPGPPIDADCNYIPITEWNIANWPSHIYLPKEVSITRPEEITLEEFASLAYPATNTDRAICAAAIAIVEQNHSISSADHLDALLLATHPKWCGAFLDQADRNNFDAIRKPIQPDLFVNEARSIEWRECRDYLEQKKAISVSHWDNRQLISIGADLTDIKAALPGGLDKIIHYVMIALHRVHDLRNNMSLATPDQMRIIQDFEKQHRNHKLAA